MKLNDKQLETLRHMLGLTRTERRDQVPYRDYYCANPNDAHLMELEQLGAVRKYSERDGYWWYSTTDAGKSAAMASAVKRRLPKSKRMYLKYLDISDCYSNLTFKDFLTDPYFAESRAQA